MGTENTGKKSAEKFSASSKESQELRKETREGGLSPLAYAVAFRETNKNLDGLEEGLETKLKFNEKLKEFDALVQKKVRDNFYERQLHKLTELPEDWMDDFVQGLGKDPEVGMAWGDLIAFDQNNVKISGVILAQQYFSGSLQKGMKERFVEKEVNGKMEKVKKTFSKRSWDVLKPYIITNILLQPAVLSTIGIAGKQVGKIAVKGVELPKNAIYGIMSGDLLREVSELGNGGDPFEYMWNGKTHHKRKFDNLKDARIFKNPEMAREHFSIDLQQVWDSMKNYKKSPEKLAEKTPEAAKFVYQAINASLSPAEMKSVSENLNAGVWDAPNIRRGLSMGVSGEILKFFFEKASDQHKKLFVDELKKISNRRYKLKPFDCIALERKFPGIQKNMTPKEKKGLQAFLGLGMTGIAGTVFLSTKLLSKVLFSVGQDVFDFTDGAGGGPNRVGKRVQSAYKLKKRKVLRFTGYKKRQFEAHLQKGDFKKSIHALGGRDGILTESEISRLTENGTLTTIQKKSVLKEIKEFEAKESRMLMVEDFWSLPSIKTLRSKDIREKIKKA